MDAQFWDEMYRSRDQVFSGDPNGVLVTEVTDLPPGQALDVGCGEGADAFWLARRGWQVTAVDISVTALQRAATAAADVEGRVAWTRADLNITPPPATRSTWCPSSTSRSQSSRITPLCAAC
ncbi:class I SAM-dependent methyltransferase [Streptomyces umbrinus]